MVRVAALCVIGIVSGTALPAAEPQTAAWPQFRGPHGSGLASAGAFPTHFGPDQKLLWKTPVPRGVSSPCVWGDRIFLTAYDDTEKKLETICIARGKGDVVWRRAVQAKEIERVHRANSPANATPATDGERVYVYFCSYGLLCYDFDGDLVWERPLPVIRSRFGSGTSPIVSGTSLFLNRDSGGGILSIFGKHDSHLLALNALTGEELWKTSRSPSNVAYATPVLARHDGNEELLVLSPGQLTSYDPSTGQPRWHLGGLPAQTCATPVIGDGRIYVSATGPFGEPDNYVNLPKYAEFLTDHDKNKDGVLQVAEVPRNLTVVDRRASGGVGNSSLSLFWLGLDPNRDANISQQEWDAFSNQLSGYMSSKPTLLSVRLGGKDDVRPTHLVWEQTRGVSEVPAPLFYKRRLYTVRNGGILHCRDAETGDEVFRGRLGAGGGYFASPVAGDDKIYLASDRGVIVVISAADELDVLARNNLTETIIATPALVASAIYVRTDRHLFAFSNESQQVP